MNRSQVWPVLGQHVLAVGAAVGPEASAVRAEVVVDLAAGTARAFASRRAPEVVLLVESADSLGRHSRAGGPQMKGLVIVSKDGGPDAIRLQPQALGYELPGEANGVLLEVVADAEVAEHLEEGEVCCVANLAHVRGPEALLRRGEASAGRLHLAGEVRLELHHAGVGEEECRVAGRYERGAWDA